MKIVHLNKEMVLENIERLIEIDRTITDEEGTWTHDNFLMKINHKWDYSLAAFIDNKIAGFVICSVKGDLLHIHRLAVLQEYQNKKIGSTLLNHVCELCRRRNISSVMLQIKKFNIEGQKFYERYGFKKIELNGPNYVYKKMMQ